MPRGTIIRENESGAVMADMSQTDTFTAAKGGRGGWGNTHFATPTRQVPRFAKNGTPGEEWEVRLELKLLADVGLVGFPNVGKSTLLSVVSQAKPTVADYHFTTLSPVLGVVSLGEGTSFVMADIPGLIEGASEGVGLGHEFLRHVERCRLLVHVVDVAGSEGRDPIEDFETINRELRSFNKELASRPMIVAGNKMDLADEAQVERFQQYVTERGYEFYPMMAAIAEGTRDLINALAARLAKLPPIRTYEAEEIPIETLEKKSRNGFTITEHDGIYFVDAPWLVPILARADMDDYDSLQYFQHVLEKSGIIDALLERGMQEGDTVSIYDLEFEYIP